MVPALGLTEGLQLKHRALFGSKLHQEIIIFSVIIEPGKTTTSSQEAGLREHRPELQSAIGNTSRRRDGGVTKNNPKTWWILTKIGVHALCATI